MPVSDDDITRLLNAPDQTRLLLGHAPKIIVDQIGAVTNEVYLYSEVARKLQRKHRLLPGHLRIIPFALDMGWVLNEGRERHTVLIYEDNIIFQKAFIIALKRTHTADEIIIKTMHKIWAYEVRRKLKKFEVVRKHLPVSKPLDSFTGK